MQDPFARLSKVTPEIREKLLAYGRLLREANLRVNLLSRRDTDDLEYRHIAFCAAVSEFFSPRAGALIADVGTGGGLPGIVFAILYPTAKIDLYDGVGKKAFQVANIVDKLQLGNARVFHARIEERRVLYDYATGRSVCNLPKFFDFVRGRLRGGKAGNLSNGVIYYKGGDLEPELAEKGIFPDAVFNLEEFFADPRFAGKTISHFDIKAIQKN